MFGLSLMKRSQKKQYPKRPLNKVITHAPDEGNVYIISKFFERVDNRLSGVLCQGFNWRKSAEAFPWCAILNLAPARQSTFAAAIAFSLTQ